jgi:hypothetical protein
VGGGNVVETCFRHPDRPAVERCEVCRRPACGSCLWYAESGERLCPDDAAIWRVSGRTVFPPERYAEGISSSEASAAAPAPDQAPYRGNSTDLSALLSALIGVVGLASCFGAVYVLPLIAFALGLVGWLQAKDSVNPRRTRWLSGVGLASGGVFILGALCLATLCLVMFVISLAVPGTRTVTLPTATP